MRTAEFIPEREAIADQLSRGKFHVVVHQVEVPFRTNKDVRCNVQPDPGAEMSHEMRAGRVVGATHKIAGVEVVIKTNALRPDPRLKLAFRAVAQLWNPHAVEIPENWSIGLVPRIQGLARLPRDLSAHSELVLQEYVSSAERQISSAIERLRTEDQRRCSRVRRR